MQSIMGTIDVEVGTIAKFNDTKERSHYPLRDDLVCESYRTEAAVTVYHKSARAVEVAVADEDVPAHPKRAPSRLIIFGGYIDIISL